ncbi:MAG: helix-turn-helix domain-containing protein [Bacteroidota bacterium]
MKAKTKDSMIEMGHRIQKLRKDNGLSQTELANTIGISLTQMARYEIKNIYPPADVLRKLADIFGTSIDYLVMGDSNEKAAIALNEAEIISQFKKIEALPNDEKKTVLKFITAYVRDFNAQQAYAS